MLLDTICNLEDTGNNTMGSYKEDKQMRRKEKRK